MSKKEQKLLDLLCEVVEKRNPKLLPIALKVGKEVLTDEQLELLDDLLASEFAENGLKVDSEPNERGILLDDLAGNLILRQFDPK